MPLEKKYLYKQILEFVIFCYIEDISFLNYTMHVCHIQYIYIYMYLPEHNLLSKI